ncbi:hypothetical protein AB0H43_28070 [Hamadaea sp. NPDC050747]|uniref:hypothetical protein n=1 Tax=Hamadaea sp. NPDC050747 TaxID=3155789 RepID=UPI0033FF3E8B
MTDWYAAMQGAKAKRRRAGLVTALLGIASGEVVSYVGGVLGEHGGLYVAAAATVVAGMVKLREFPRRSLLVRFVAGTLWLLSVVAAAVAAFGPPSWQLYAVIVSIAITALALVVVEAGAAFRLLMGASFVGLGLASIGLGVSSFVGHDFMLGLAAVSYGALLLLSVPAVMEPGVERTLAERLTIAAGTALNLAGLNLILHGGVGSKILGALLLLPAAWLWFAGRLSEELGFAATTVRALLGAAAVCLVTGAFLIVRSQYLAGVAGIYLGIGLAGITLQYVTFRPAATVQDVFREFYAKATRDPDDTA